MFWVISVYFSLRNILPKSGTLYIYIYVGSQNSSVGIATRYGLDGPGIESRSGEIFRTCPDRPRGPTSLRHNVYPVFPGGKAAKAWRLPPTPSSAEVKERVELYFYYPSGTSLPVLGRTLPLPLYIYIQGVTGGTDQTWGECSLGQTIPI